MSARLGAGLAAAAAAAALLAGCFLPVSTAAPQSARTIGAGNYGTSFTAELPTLNLIADDGDGSGDGDLAIAPNAAMSLGIQYGVSDGFDLEGSLDGGLYLFFLPLPLGASGGFRWQIASTEQADLALAARVGWTGISSGEGESEESANASYGAASLAVQFKPTRSLRPLLALQAMPARVHVDLEGAGGADSFTATAVSGTFGLALVTGSVQLTPFVTGTWFSSDRVEQSYFVTGGITLARRPDPEPPRLMAPR